MSTVLDPFALTVLGVAVMAGAVTLRVTGMGLSLVAVPFLVIALGPFEGILVANVCGVAASALNLLRVGRDVDWRRALLVTPAGVLGVIPGAIAARVLPSGILAVIVSGLVLLGLAFAIFARRLRLPNSPVVAAAGGLTSGFMSVTAAVGGPGLVVYALATGWKHHRFAATAQVHFIALGVCSLLTKQALPTIGWTGWLVLAGALLIGLMIGTSVSYRVDARQAMRLMIVVAAIGAVIALVQGLVTL